MKNTLDYACINTPLTNPLETWAIHQTYGVLHSKGSLHHNYYSNDGYQLQHLFQDVFSLPFLVSISF